MSAFERTRIAGGGTPLASPWGIDSETGALRDLLLGPMDHYAWQTGNAMARRSIRLGRSFDVQVARGQFDAMLEAYAVAGITTHQLTPDPALPYQIYARDSSVMTPWGAIITSMYSPWRRGEWLAVLDFYRSQDIPIFDVVTAGSFEGGDFMVLEPGVILCGYSSERTSEEGLNQVRAWIEAEGWEFHAYAFDPFFLHLDVKVAALAPKLVAVCVDAVEPELVTWFKAKGYRIVDISFKQVLELGVNVVSLGDERVILPSDNDELKAACKAEGLTVFDPDISQFTAGGGGIHCMCQALRRDPLT